MRSLRRFAAALLACATFGACAQDDPSAPASDLVASDPVHVEATAETATGSVTAPDPPSCDDSEISVHCGAAPTVSVDPQGRLWAIFVQEGFAWVVRSEDFGATWSDPVPVNTEAEVIETNGENRPKIIVSPQGPIYVSWTKKVEGRFKGDIRFSRSLDGGAAFEAVRTINDDGLLTGHRFESLHVDAAGDVYLVWIDKRDREAAKQRGEDYRGAALYYAVSVDQGASFAANRRIAHHACECCRIAVAERAEGVGVLWRHVFEGEIRDHAFAIVDRDGVALPLRRVAIDGWKINGCPHHGPAMLSTRDPGAETPMVWFTGAEQKPAVYFGLFEPETGEIRRQTEIASSAAAHADLNFAGGEFFTAWKDVGEEETIVSVRSSADDGITWTPPRTAATTAGASDHPFLIEWEGRVRLSWWTKEEGLRILEI